MLRKRLALLLALSWVILSGYDVIEDLDLPDRIEIHNPADALSGGAGSAGLLARNIVESADRPHLRYANLLEHYLEFAASSIRTLSQRVFKLHKVNQVFLI
ncbi:MAG TPA: hypothetical protein VMR88_12720 [Candidatus Polarisedimenticolaceae bacterium]|nr:hypothetical protein [Candidatus Polarisedimenticolaceae bacterium]